MDFGIGDKDAHGAAPPKRDDTSSGQAVPSQFVQDPTASSHFEDDLMREFEQKHSKLSSFLEETAPLKVDKTLSSAGAATGDRSSELYHHSFGLSSYDQNDDLMRQFENQQSKLSSFLDDRSTDLTSSSNLQSQAESQKQQHHAYNEFEIMKKNQEDDDDDLKQFMGDMGVGGTSSSMAFAKTEQPGAGDHGHEQLLSQFERVSPNMMNFSYDDPVSSSRTNNDLLVDFQAAAVPEVPLPGGQNTYSVPSSFDQRTTSQQPQQHHHHHFDEDEEDDFEKDSISQQSQPLSSKLSDSLEALKDIPREFPLPIQDHHFSSSATPPPTSSSTSASSAVPTTIFTRHEYEEEDDFDKDSISHPLSQKLSDSLEVLKDSPQKDLRLDESLMDLEELSSSAKNSISPNEAVNVIDALNAEISAATPLGNLHYDAKQQVSSSESVTKPPPYERPQVTSATPFDNLPEVSSSTPFGNSAAFTNSSRTNTPFAGNLSSDINNSPFGNLSEYTTTKTTFGNSSDIITTTTTTSSALIQDDIPPPIPPHQNLGGSRTVSSSSSSVVKDSFDTTTRSQKDESIYKNTYYESSYKYSDEPESMIPEIPARKVEAKRDESPPMEFGDIGRSSSRKPFEIESHQGGGLTSLHQEQTVGPAFTSGASLMTSSITMSTSLDDVIQPSSFYDSEESSTKTDALLDTEILNQDLDEFLPKDSYDVTTTSTTNNETQNFESVLGPSGLTGKEGKVGKEPEAKVVQEKQQQKHEEKPKIIEQRQPPKPRQAQPMVEFSEDVQKILNTFDPRAWFDPEKLHPQVEALVYWRDPKKSGVVFGSIFVVLLALAFLSFISVVAYTSLAVLSGTLAFRIYKSVLQAIQKTNEGHPFKEFLDADLTVSSEKAQEVSTAVVSHLNCVANKLRSLFLVEDIVESAKFGALLYLLTYIGAWFNGLTLVILGFIALFGLPKVYETNKIIIDQYIDLVSGKISEVYAKVSAVIPFGKKEKAQ